MLKELNEIKEHLSFEVIDYEVINYKVYLKVRKRGGESSSDSEQAKRDEELTFVFQNTSSLKAVLSDIKKQIQFKTLNAPTKNAILQTMTDNNCNWLLTDNNFNFVQCMNDKNYNPICKESQIEFMRKKDRWAVGRKIKDGKLIFIDNNEMADYEITESAVYSQKTYLLDTDEFVYVPGNSATMLVPSETMYLFYLTPKGEFHLHLLFNKSWIY